MTERTGLSIHSFRLILSFLGFLRVLRVFVVSFFQLKPCLKIPITTNSTTTICICGAVCASIFLAKIQSAGTLPSKRTAMNLMALLRL